MTHAEIRAGLAAHPLFCAARPETVDALAEAAQAVDVLAGERAFCEGDAASYMFVVASGELDAIKRADGGAEIVMRTLGEGEVGGLTNLAGDAPRSATLQARGPARLYAIDKPAFVEAMRTDAALTAAVLRALGRKIRDKNTQVATLLQRTQRDPREKIVFFDAKPYERAAFDARMPESLRARYIEARLGPDTARLADGFPVVCAFVNDDLSRPVIEELGARGVRLLAMRCAGYNNVDLAAATQAGIAVARVPAYSPHAVAEHTIALLLTLVRKTHRASARVRDGNFSLAGLVGFDLFGKTAGVVGTGKIGAIVATILRGFGMNVLAFDRAEQIELVRTGVRYTSLDEIFATCDVISLHVPLTDETHHMVDAKRLSSAKKGLVLLNTSRGGLVDAAALVASLKTDHLGGAGLDVYEEESEYFFRDRSDHAVLDDLLARLMTFPNVLITSHQAFLTTEALDNIAEATLASVAEHLAGQPLTRAVRA
jgi:D-lactate dehydrogenase